MDNPAYNETHDDFGDENENGTIRRNSADYQTANIGSDDAVTTEKPNVGPGEVTFDTKVTMDDERVKQRRPVRKARDIPLKPYAGMNKEDLLRFSNTPFWNRMRMACLVFFWLCWLGLLAAVIALTIVLPRCTAPPIIEKWQSSVYYQIYVRSFFDSNGDGVGDINGITSKLDYLQENNVDSIVLSSIYQSHETPGSTNPDFGYEVVNHTEVSPDYGTLDDLKHLLDEAHSRDMSVLMDFIPGHTGTEHPWFTASSQATNIGDDYRNFYIWANCTSSNFPNNWRSLYNEQAWRNSTRSRPGCFLSQFLETQPQLNLRSAVVRDELENILRFWLDLGVDGFKVINAPFLFVDYDLRDEPRLDGCTDTDSYDCYDHVYTRNQDETYNVIASWRHLLDEYSANTNQIRVLLTDADENINGTAKFYGQYGANAANFPMNYVLRHVLSNCTGVCLQETINDWLNSVPSGATSNWATTNQDSSRNETGLSVNVINLLTLTLPGGAIFYYGDELGLEDGPRENPPVDPVGLLDLTLSRDPFRTPMPWSNETDGGFVNQSVTTVEDPWLPAYPNYPEINVLVQESIQKSPLNNFRRLATLRHEQGALRFGDFRFGVVQSNIISYIREYDGYDNLMVIANIGRTAASADLSRTNGAPGSGTLLFTSDPDDGRVEDESVSLRSFSLQPGHGAIVSWPFSRPT